MRTREPVLAFDIETVPDVGGLRLKHNFPATLPDREVVEMSERVLRQEKSSDFFPLPYQRVVVISGVLRDFANDSLTIFSLPKTSDDDADGDEKSAIEGFFRGLNKYRPTLVSWNGGGFDLPVLHYRALLHGVSAPAYWHSDDRWNTYLNRFHEKHTDLMDVLAAYQTRAWASLNDVAVLCKLPGKDGMSGGGVWDAYQNGEIDNIRHYCETDALLTYLLYARFQHFRGDGDWQQERDAVRRHLDGEARWQEFLARWREAESGESGESGKDGAPPDGALL